MIKPNLTGMKNLLGTRKPTGFKDSDGDGVKNFFDCQPFNKNKQGIISDIKQGFKRRAEASKIRRVRVREERFMAREQQEIRAVKEIERIRAERKIKRAKAGGFLMQVAKAHAARPRITPIKRLPAKRRKKKKKGRVRVSHIAAPRQQSFGDYLRTNL